jgi:hypothetical protein
MGITNASQWQSAIVVYLLGYISYGVTLVFYASIFPRLARNTQKTKDARAQFDRGEISVETMEESEMLERNRLSTISTAHSNCMPPSPFLFSFSSSSFPLFHIVLLRWNDRLDRSPRRLQDLISASD